MSLNNTIIYNKINNVGLKTRDLGGISLLGDGITNSKIMYNCVKNVIGTDQNSQGNILSPFYSWGIYLDNYSSGYYVFANIAHSNVNTGYCFLLKLYIYIYFF